MRVIEEVIAAFAVLVTVMLTLRQVIRFGQALVVVPGYMRPTGLVVRVKLVGLAPQVNVLVVAVAGVDGAKPARNACGRPGGVEHRYLLGLGPSGW